MLQLYKLALSVHVLAGITGLAAFWTPAIARKGGRTHVQVGRIFYNATVLIALTGLAMAALLVMAPTPGHPRVLAPFLVYLVLITFAPVYHGVRVLETRRDPPRLHTPFHTALNATTLIAAAGMVGLALYARQPVFAALAPIGVLVGLGNLGFARRPPESRMAWWYEHMGSMLGGGIAFHTAFLVIGAGRLLSAYLTGVYAVIPWVLPAIVGIPATRIWIAYYRRRFEGRDAGSGTRDAKPGDSQIQGSAIRNPQIQGSAIRNPQIQGSAIRNPQIQGFAIRDSQIQGFAIRDSQIQGFAIPDSQIQGFAMRDSPIQGFAMRDSPIRD